MLFLQQGNTLFQEEEDADEETELDHAEQLGAVKIKTANVEYTVGFQQGKDPGTQRRAYKGCHICDEVPEGAIEVFIAMLGKIEVEERIKAHTKADTYRAVEDGKDHIEPDSIGANEDIADLHGCVDKNEAGDHPIGRGTVGKFSEKTREEKTADHGRDGSYIHKGHGEINSFQEKIIIGASVETGGNVPEDGNECG